MFQLKRHLLRKPFKAQQLRHCAFEDHGGSVRGRLSNARLRFVQRHNAVLSPISTSLGHLGYIIGLFEYGVTDIWWLRICAVCGCSMVVLFQVLQPRCQFLSAGWCFVYVVVNLFQLHWVSLSVPEPRLSEEEEKLFKLLGDTLSVREFADLIGFGEWQTLKAGERLSQEGQVVEADKAMLYFIAEGQCEVFSGGRLVAKLSPGSFVGEVSYLLHEGLHSPSATVMAAEEVRCLAIPLHEIRVLLRRRPDLQKPLLQLLTRDLLMKESGVSKEALDQRRYKAVLEVACPMANQPGIADGVATYRRRNGISSDEHKRLIATVPCSSDPWEKVSWSPGAFLRSLNTTPELADKKGGHRGIGAGQQSGLFGLRSVLCQRSVISVNSIEF
eukprot:symbB.v1.2.032130.t1/scaffold3813.1/size49824/2